jgi:hypothetical protein
MVLLLIIINIYGIILIIYKLNMEIEIKYNIKFK